MTHNIGDPGHISVHAGLVTPLEALATEWGATVALPDAPTLGELGHVDDHNMIVQAIRDLHAEMRAQGGTVAELPVELPATVTAGELGHVDDHNAIDAAILVLEAGRKPYNDATGGVITEYDETITRTKLDGQQFATDTGGYTPANVNATLAAVNGWLAATKVNAEGSTGGTANKVVTATAGKTYTFSADVMFDGDLSGSIQVICQDGVPANITNGTFTTPIDGKSGTRVSVTFVAPPTTSQVRLRLVQAGTNPAGSVVKWDNVLFESSPAAPALPTWFDGATASASSGRRMRCHAFTTAGTDTFTVLQSVKPWRVLVCGGGGGGASGDNNSDASHRGGAGGAGGQSYQNDTATLELGAYVVTVGAGGRGSLSAPGSGSPGGSSSLGTFATAAGGAGGAQFVTPPARTIVSNITGPDTNYCISVGYGVHGQLEYGSSDGGVDRGGAGGYYGRQGCVMVAYQIG